MTTFKTISTTIELAIFLAKFNGPVSVVLKTKTEQKMNKKDVATKSIANPFPTVYKLQELEVQLNVEYEDKVNDNRLMEGVKQNFKAEGLSWGTAIDNILIQKGEELYIKTFPVKSIGSPTFLTSDGNIVNKAALQAFIPVPSETSRQGTEDKVVVRTFKMSSILEMSFDGGKVIYSPK